MFFRWWRNRRRRKLRQQPLPPAQRELVAQHVGHWRLLSDAEQRELAGHIQVLLHEKHFEACGGLELTDEMRLTVAAQAALLLLGRETDYFPGLVSILIYPARYVVEAERRLPDGTVVEGEELRAGESWYRGSVVLSWDDSRHGAYDVRDGHNVVLHEFAHQLDSESGAMNGAPLLPRGDMYADWSRVLGEEFEQLKANLARRRRGVIRPYGATNPPEFFAVVTEAFFEQPVALLQQHPALYAQFRAFFRQDPAARVRRQAGV